MGVALMISKLLPAVPAASRRHLDSAQRGVVAVNREAWFAEQNRERVRGARSKGGKAAGKGRPQVSSGDESSPELLRDESNRSLTQAAKAVGAGITSTKKLKQVKEKAGLGKVNVSEASRLAELEEGDRKVAVSLVVQGKPVTRHLFSIGKKITRDFTSLRVSHTHTV